MFSMMPGGLAAGAEESHFAAAAVQTRPPPAMLEVRSSWQLQLTTADLIPPLGEKKPLHLCGCVDVFFFAGGCLARYLLLTTLLPRYSVKWSMVAMCCVTVFT